MNTNKKGVILLSGGLDSLVSLDMAKDLCKIEMSLTFDYGQKAYEEEKKAAIDISKHYNIEHKIIKIPFLKDLSNNALTNDNNTNFNSIDDVWIPNRNGLFLNIAACFCDKYKYNYIIFGANKEESIDFSDNSEEFVFICQDFFKFSTINHPNVIAPCLKFDKIEIINYAIERNLPINLIKSCYKKSKNNKKHCGECMSCKLLYNAIKNSKKPELLGEFFE